MALLSSAPVSKGPANGRDGSAVQKRPFGSPRRPTLQYPQGEASFRIFLKVFRSLQGNSFLGCRAHPRRRSVDTLHDDVGNMGSILCGVLESRVYPGDWSERRLCQEQHGVALEDVNLVSILDNEVSAHTNKFTSHCLAENFHRRLDLLQTSATTQESME